MDLITSAHEKSRMNLEIHDGQVYRHKLLLTADENFRVYNPLYDIQIKRTCA
jgi:hypothetical protein